MISIDAKLNLYYNLGTIYTSRYLYKKTLYFIQYSNKRGLSLIEIYIRQPLDVEK